MSKTHRVLNVTRGLRMKLAQAERAVEACSAIWVEHGVSLRDASFGEAIALRNAQAAEREPLASAERPGQLFDPGTRRLEGHRRERALAQEAGVFAASVV